MRVVRSEFKLAMASVRATRWRSLLTMLGIIIGIVSVVTVVSIGEGVKRQIAGQLNHFGSDLITIIPGDVQDRGGRRGFVSTSLLTGPSAQTALGAGDLHAVRQVPHVAQSAPLSQIPGQVSVEGKAYSDITVLGTGADLPKLLRQPVAYGAFFAADDEEQHVAVIGKDIAQELFQENAPLGMSFEFRGESFMVRGVFGDFANVPFSPLANFNRTIFIPYESGAKLAGDNAQLYAILAKPDASTRTGGVIKDIDHALDKVHGNQPDFSVLNQEQAVAATSDVLNLLSKLIAGVAAISLLVGGVGIMNVMLVSVTERMHEIGVRKAIGATNRQIWRQFMLESVVISGLGGVVGVTCSVIISLLLRAYSDLKPVISWQAMVLATLVSVAVGIIFGTAPALKAARKDPIEALRHE